MKNQKTSDSQVASRRSSSGRRDFLLRSGTVVSAMLAPSAAGVAHGGAGESRLDQNLAQREDEAAIRQLYQEYAARVAAGAIHADPPESSDAEPVELRLMQDPVLRPVLGVDIPLKENYPLPRPLHCLGPEPEGYPVTVARAANLLPEAKAEEHR